MLRSQFLLHIGRRWLSSSPNWNAASIRQLRDLTGAPVMECKKALERCDGKLDAALGLLSSYAETVMRKKAQRSTRSGLIALEVAPDQRCGAMVEIRSETDFVHQLPVVQRVSQRGLELLLRGAVTNVQELLEALRDELREAVAKTDENLTVHRGIRLQVPDTFRDGRIYSYLHNHARVGVLVACSAPSPLGRQVAMHIAAMNPQYVSAADIEPSVYESLLPAEDEAFRAPRQLGAANASPPQRRSVKFEAFIAERCLLDQVLVTDSADERSRSRQRTVREAIGPEISVLAFERFAL